MVWSNLELKEKDPFEILREQGKDWEIPDLKCWESKGTEANREELKWDFFKTEENCLGTVRILLLTTLEQEKSMEYHYSGEGRPKFI